MGQRGKRPVKPLWYVNFTKSFLDQLKRLKLIGNWLLISCYIILLASINWHLSPRSTLAQWVYLRPSTNFQIKPQHRQTHFLFPSAILPSNGLSSGRSYIHPLCQFSSNLQINTATSPRFLPKEMQASLMQNFPSGVEQGETWLYLFCRFTPKDIPLHLIII